MDHSESHLPKKWVMVIESAMSTMSSIARIVIYIHIYIKVRMRLRFYYETGTLGFVQLNYNDQLDKSSQSCLSGSSVWWLKIIGLRMNTSLLCPSCGSPGREQRYLRVEVHDFQSPMQKKKKKAETSDKQIGVRAALISQQVYCWRILCTGTKKRNHSGQVLASNRYRKGKEALSFKELCTKETQELQTVGETFPSI